MLVKAIRNDSAHHTYSVVELVGKEVAIEGRSVHINIIVADSSPLSFSSSRSFKMQIVFTPYNKTQEISRSS